MAIKPPISPSLCGTGTARAATSIACEARERAGVRAASVKNGILIHQQYRSPPPRPSPAAGFALRGRGKSAPCLKLSVNGYISGRRGSPFTYTFPATLYVNGVGVLTHHSGTSRFNGGASPTLYLPHGRLRLRLTAPATPSAQNEAHLPNERWMARGNSYDAS